MSGRRCLIARDLLTMAGPPAAALRGPVGDAAREEAQVEDEDDFLRETA